MYKTIKILTENSDFQYIETLRRNRVKRNHTGVFFVEGVRAITQAVENEWEIKALIFYLLWRINCASLDNTLFLGARLIPSSPLEE